MEKYKKYIKESKNFEDIYSIPWKAYLDEKIEKTL